MRITLNHNPDIIDSNKDEITVEQLLALKNFSFELLIVRVNGELVKKDNYSSTLIKEGDNVQVIHVFGGG
ncbi:MAG TPA: sulfur carrier protein ThiS [Bacteroidetes bacterium]|nr:sulfur carrier protein ThiS [Bacteroidota bacterium]